MVHQYHLLPEEVREARSVQEKEFQPPRTPTEETLADIWAYVLGVERVGRQHNFFELGGDSLLATRVISRIRSRFQVDLPFHTLIEAPTVAGLAQHIDAFSVVIQDPQDQVLLDKAGYTDWEL
jgi:acyl carrier protein